MLQCDQSKTSAVLANIKKKGTKSSTIEAASQLWCTIKVATSSAATATQIARRQGLFCLQSLVDTPPLATRQLAGRQPAIRHPTIQPSSHPGGQQVFSVLFSVQLKSAYTPDTPPQVLAVAAVDKQTAKGHKRHKGGCVPTLEFCFLAVGHSRVSFARQRRLGICITNGWRQALRIRDMWHKGRIRNARGEQLKGWEAAEPSWPRSELA